jgi:hypothetical protein
LRGRVDRNSWLEEREILNHRGRDLELREVVGRREGIKRTREEREEKEFERKYVGARVKYQSRSSNDSLPFSNLSPFESLVLFLSFL